MKDNMNSDKRKRFRVQGGWAASTPSHTHMNKVKNHPVTSSISPNKEPSANSHEKNTEATTDLKRSVHNARSDKGKPQMPAPPIWTGKNIDRVVLKQKFVFEDPDEEIKLKPADQVITKPGVYDISTKPSGVSRLRYFPKFIEPAYSEAIFAELLHAVTWQQRHDIHNGVQALHPRLTAWYSEVPYTYGGATHEANTSEWPSALKQLKEQLVEVTGVEFDSLATNLYRDGHDSIGWHSDDEPIFGKTPIIASLSFGEERVFELRKKPPPNESGESDYTYCQVIRVPLRSGDLLIMEGWLQADWQHRVPKEYHDRGARINVTFRVVRHDGKSMF